MSIPNYFQNLIKISSIIFKYFQIIFILNSLLLSASLPFGKLYVKNGKLMGEGGRWAQLRGMSLFHSQMIEGAVFYNAETVYKLKCNWHVNVVRACLGIMNYGNGGYFVHRELERAKVKAVIDAAIKYDIYVVVSFHYTGDTLYTREASEYFKELSYEYKGRWNMIYEIYNEAIHNNWYTLKQYHESVIRAIRENDKDAVIICATPYYDQHISEAIKYPITNYYNIMYTLHFYASEQGVENLRKNVFYALELNFPLFVTEYGLTFGNGTGPVNKYETEKW
uniref:Glycoside hydrolase family 5 domain-containing protein n=1 Tax=Meloidogyne enterolobii TaxID=390850 RepID=A0A6V7U878_MELEN|nr:unnamed protein product [Meloidogyne enterolobii]